MNRLYISDLDHTFLRSDLSVSDFSKDIWNSKQSITNLSIATARSFYSAMSILDNLDFKSPMILLDGVLIATQDKKILDAKFVNKEVANELILEAIRFDNIHPFVIGLKDNELNETFDYPSIRTDTQDTVLLNYRNDTRLIEKYSIKADDKTFKVVYMAKKERLIALTSHLKSKFQDVFEFKLSPENYTGDYFLTILHPLGDKAHALKFVSEYMDIEFKNISVFGDSLNDIGMFKLAGTSLAVKNALDETKEHASKILEHSNDEDAVAKYLQNIR